MEWKINNNFHKIVIKLNKNNKKITSHPFMQWRASGLGYHLSPMVHTIFCMRENDRIAKLTKFNSFRYISHIRMN